MNDNSGQFIELRAQLLAEKDFLSELQGSHGLRVRHFLNLASKKQLKVLIKVIHLIVSGKIPLQKAHFAKIIKSKKLKALKSTFEVEKDINAILSKSRADILKLLYRFQSVISFLLSSLKEA